VLTGELADSLHREYVLEGRLHNKRGTDAASVPSSIPEASSKLVELEKQLLLERQKRHQVENHFRGTPDYSGLYKENEFAEKSRQLVSARLEVERLSKELQELHDKSEKQASEITALNSQLPELRDLEAVHKMVGSPIELQKQIDELKADKISLSRTLEESSTRGPMGEKLRTVEGQRDAFREALRSLRERKDAETRSYADRIKVLEARLEKEKLLNSSMTRHLTESPSSTSLSSNGRLNSPTALAFDLNN
jgi:myosin heavy subunit